MPVQFAPLIQPLHQRIHVAEWRARNVRIGHPRRVGRHVRPAAFGERRHTVGADQEHAASRGHAVLASHHQSGGVRTQAKQIVDVAGAGPSPEAAIAADRLGEVVGGAMVAARKRIWENGK